MLRTALIAILLTGVASTAMASDRIRVAVSYDSGGYGYSRAGDRHYRDRGHYRDHYRRGGRHYGYDRRWDRDYGRSYGRNYGRSYGWSSRHYYSPRPYYYGGYGRYRDSRYGHGRYCPDRWHRH
jgi:hypothetical protein